MRLYVDGLNYAIKWFPKSSDPFDILAMKLNIQRFVDSCHRQDIELAIFLDAKRHSEEANKKFISRHERRVSKSEVNSIPLKETFIGDIFRNLNVKVYYR